MHYYPMYGLQFACNLPWPGLPDGPRPPAGAAIIPLLINPPDADWQAMEAWPWGPYPRGATHERGYHIESAALPAGPAFRLSFQGLHGRAQYVLAPGAAAAWGRAWSDVLSVELQHANILSLWLSRVINMVLTLQGLLCLHGSVLTDGRRALAFVGPSGAGKSTLAAAWLERGWELLADDRLVLHPQANTFWAQPGAPRLRLWPEALEHFGHAPESLPAVLTQEAKRYLALPAAPPAAQPLSAVYVLLPRRAGLTAPRIQTLAPPAAWRALFPHQMGASARSTAQQAAAHAQLAHLAASLPVHELHRPDSLAALPAVVEAILQTEAGRG